MKTHANRIIPSDQRWMLTALSLAVAVLVGTVFTTRAAPVYPMPDPFGAHPGFGINLPPTGPGFLPPGGVLPPLFFADGIPSPDIGHWELEFNNPNPFPIGFDVTLLFPGGPVTGGLFLPPGSSGYFDIGYLDSPPEVSPPLWFVTAGAAPGAPIGAGITIDTDAIETAGPIHPPGLAFFASGGPGGPGGFGPLFGGPGVTVTLGVVPEPSSLALLGVGLVGLVTRARMRKKNLV